MQWIDEVVAREIRIRTTAGLEDEVEVCEGEAYA